MTEGAARPHVLYVAWAFPPMSGGGTYRTLATVNALAEVGFDVTVLTAERTAFLGLSGVDPGLEQGVDPRVRVVRVPFERPRFDFDIRRWPKERVNDPNTWVQRYAAHERDAFPEEHFGPWLPVIVGQAERIHRERPIDLVLGSAKPHVVVAVGDHLHTRYGVPHVIDYRDAWRLDYYTSDETGTDDPRIEELETRYFESAHEVWFVNEPVRQWHQARCPQSAGRMRVVANGFDPSFAPAPRLAGPRPGDPLAFTYVGTIRDRVPIAEMVDGWVWARRDSAELAGARASIWGNLSARDRVKRQLLAGARPYGLHYQGPVAHADVARLYAESDVLLLILSAGRYVTSGKVYEYLASGLPIVSVHEPGNGASDVLSNYPLWFPAADLSVHAVADALIEAADGARSATPDLRRQCVEVGRKFERSQQLGQPVGDLYDFVRSAR